MPKKDLKIGDLIFVRKYVNGIPTYGGISEGEPGIVLDIDKYSIRGRHTIVTLYWKQILGYYENEFIKLDKEKEEKYWLLCFCKDKNYKENKGIIYNEEINDFVVGRVEYQDALKNATKDEIAKYNKIIKNIKRRY